AADRRDPPGDETQQYRPQDDHRHQHPRHLSLPFAPRNTIAVRCSATGIRLPSTRARRLETLPPMQRPLDDHGPGAVNRPYPPEGTLDRPMTPAASSATSSHDSKVVRAPAARSSAVRADLSVSETN